MENVTDINTCTIQDFMSDFIEYLRSPADWSVLHQESDCFIRSTSLFEIGPCWAGVAEMQMGRPIIMRPPMCCIRSELGKFVIVSAGMNEIAGRYSGLKSVSL